jgi:uncharacterized protein (DUF983 family)
MAVVGWMLITNTKTLNYLIMLLLHLLYSTFANKCSRCNKGDVFVSNNPYDLGKIFKLHKTCSHCHLEYEKEPSFFYGAMYVSYAISSGWFMIWYALQSFVLNWETLNFALFITGFIIVVSPLTLRWSRLIWLNFFYKFRKEYKNQNTKQLTNKIQHT